METDWPPPAPHLSRVLLPVPEAARQCGISVRLMWQVIAEGQLPTVMIHRRRLVAAADLDQFVAALRTPQSSGAS